ncbi:MAG: flavodoxin family protein [Eubacteriales bacterium]
MKIQIVYHSDSGNTKKLALAIAEELALTAEEITAQPKIQDVDLLFVGGSWRAFNLERNCKAFLKGLDTTQVKNVAFFSTSAGGRGIAKFAEKIFKGKEIHILPEECNKKSGADKQSGEKLPGEQDCQDAKEFAKKTVASLS